MLHKSLMSHTHPRVMIRMTQPPPALLMTMHIHPIWELLLLLKHYHCIPIFILWPSSLPMTLLPVLVLLKDLLMRLTYEHCKLADFPRKFAEWSVFLFIVTMLSEMLIVCCSTRGTGKYPCHLVTIMGKGEIVKCSSRKSYAELWMTQALSCHNGLQLLLVAWCMEDVLRVP